MNKYMGQYNSDPEKNCCACGKEKPVYTVMPSIFPNQCSHRDQDKDSKAIVELCKIGNEYKACNGQLGIFCT